jgi:hypothetical protein
VPVMPKQEADETPHLPPSGSVDNPMEVDDSDDDEVVVHSSTVTPKRKKKRVCVVGNLRALAELLILVPPPGGETSGKRPKPGSSHPSGSEDSAPPAASQVQVVPMKGPESSKKLVRGKFSLLKAYLTHFCLIVVIVGGLQVEATQRCEG